MRLCSSLRLYAAVIAASFTVLGCGGDSTTAPTAGLRTGRYAYAAGSPLLTGTLTFTYTSPDSVAGVWDVPAYQPAVLMGQWNLDAYIVYARYSSAVMYTHRITRTGGCSGRIANGATFACTLEYIGP